MTHGARLQQAPAVCHGYGHPRAKAIVMSNGGKISWTCSVFSYAMWLMDMSCNFQGVVSVLDV
jgi:hypothetical protein